MYSTVSQLIEEGTLTEEEIIHLLVAADRDLEEDPVDLEDADDAVVIKANGCIQKAQDLIDSFLRTRYTLPLSTTPGLIKTLSDDFSIYYMHEVRHKKDMPEDLKEKFVNNLKLLNQIQKGDVNPGLSDQTSQADVIIKTSGQTKTQIFTDDLLDKF